MTSPLSRPFPATQDMRPAAGKGGDGHSPGPSPSRQPTASLSPEELSVVQALAEPIAFGQQATFVAVVTEAETKANARGPGAVHRIASALR